MPKVLKVLVIDDEVGMRAGIVRALKNFVVDLPDVGEQVSFEFFESGTAEEGLEMINSVNPDILLLDHKLPGMTGLDLLKQVDLKKKEILAVMITAYASLETAIEATRNGAYDFLSKPFTPAELKNMIKKASSRLIFKRQAKQLAEEKRRLRFEFISVLTHELKSPLAAIEGYLNIFKNRDLGKDITGYDHIIDRSLIRLEGMQKLIFDLLDLTRIESKQKKREFEKVDLSEIVEHCIETAEIEAEKRGIKIKKELDADLIVNADRSEMEIILNNLISNAVKYNKDDGDVDIVISKEADKVTIKVTDTGIGLSQTEAKKLFKDFVRIKNQKTHKILGSGLGLSVVKKLAMMYEGDAVVESEPDVGSTFTVELREA